VTTFDAVILRRLAIAAVIAASLTVPARAQLGAIKVYILAGQSNGMAVGDGALTPQLPAGCATTSPPSCAGYQFFNGVLSPANDPVGRAAPGTYVNAYNQTVTATIGGSEWPSFIETMFGAQGEPLVIVPTNVGATAVCPQADIGNGYWDADTPGSLLADSIAQTQTALAALVAAGWSPSDTGVIWDGGEEDGWAIEAGIETEQDFKDCLYTVIQTYQAAFPNARFWIVRIGQQSPSNPGWAQVGAGEEDLAAAFHDGSSAPNNVRIAWRGAAQCALPLPPLAGLSWDILLDTDDIHWNPYCLDMAGRGIAHGILNDQADPWLLYEPDYPLDQLGRELLNTAQ
jgi:hypothetical protein